MSTTEPKIYWSSHLGKWVVKEPDPAKEVIFVHLDRERRGWIQDDWVAVDVICDNCDFRFTIWTSESSNPEPLELPDADYSHGPFCFHEHWHLSKRKRYLIITETRPFVLSEGDFIYAR